MRMSENTPFWRHPGKFPPALLTFKRHLPVTKADVLLTFCTYSMWRKKPAVKTAGETSQDGVLMATMRCARRHARGHQLQIGADIESDFWLISILWPYYVLYYCSVSLEFFSHCFSRNVVKKKWTNSFFYSTTLQLQVYTSFPTLLSCWSCAMLSKAFLNDGHIFLQENHDQCKCSKI